LSHSINWQAIDTVLLDMDGTILDLGFDNFFWLEHLPQTYADKNNLSLQQSKQHLADSYATVEGTLAWYCLDFWSDKLNIDIVKLKHDVQHKIQFRPYAVDFLSFLVEQNKRIILATNAHPKALEIKHQKTKFDQYFCQLNSSHTLGYPKEDQQYWHLLQQEYDFDKERTLFVDDSIKILQSAQTFGIKHLRAIAQPDMRRDKINTSPFIAIDDYREVITCD
jgi:5'-nucleotidase